MGTTLQNGIFLPAEGERNCYTGLASNWTILDGVIGGYSSHAANLTIHVTAEDKRAWNGKADASALTAHTGDTTIHVTAADKQTWNTGVTRAYVLRYASVSLTALGTVAFSALDNTDNIKIGDKVLDSEGKLFALTAVDTANSTATLSALLIDLSKDSDLSNYYTKGETDTLLSYKATDSNVMHLSGNETASGTKNFSGILRVYNSNSSLNTAEIWLKNSKVNRGQAVYGDQGLWFRDATDKRVTAIISRITSNGASALLLYAFNENQDNQQVSNYLSFIKYLDGTCYLLPDQNDAIVLGSSSAKFKSINTNLINDLNPGSLGMPNLNNGVDISSYITDLTGASNVNKYTPTVNGWISIGLSSADFIEIYIPASLMGATFTKSTMNSTSLAFMPVIANKEVKITLKGSSIGWAKFYPCQGNV